MVYFPSFILKALLFVSVSSNFPSGTFAKISPSTDEFVHTFPSSVRKRLNLKNAGMTSPHHLTADTAFRNKFRRSSIRGGRMSGAHALTMNEKESQHLLMKDVVGQKMSGEFRKVTVSAEQSVASGSTISSSGTISTDTEPQEYDGGRRNAHFLIDSQDGCYNQAMSASLNELRTMYLQEAQKRVPSNELWNYIKYTGMAGVAGLVGGVFIAFTGGVGAAEASAATFTVLSGIDQGQSLGESAVTAVQDVANKATASLGATVGVAAAKALPAPIADAASNINLALTKTLQDEANGAITAAYEKFGGADPAVGAPQGNGDQTRYQKWQADVNLELFVATMKKNGLPENWEPLFKESLSKLQPLVSLCCFASFANKAEEFLDYSSCSKFDMIYGDLPTETKIGINKHLGDIIEGSKGAVLTGEALSKNTQDLYLAEQHIPKPELPIQHIPKPELPIPEPELPIPPELPRY